MEDKSAALFLNGEYKKIEFYENTLKSYDMIVCADGAGNMLYKLKMLPKLLLGDLDSIGAEALSYFEENHVEIQCFPPEKDYTDSQLCLMKLKALGYMNIDVYGGFGGRTDHSLGNVGLIYWAYKEGLSLSLIDENCTLKGLTVGETSVSAKKDAVFSILSVFEDMEGVSISGAKYSLSEGTIKRGEPRGISNEFLDEKAVIKLEKGFGLLCVTNKI